MQITKITTPHAKQQHKCQFCEGVINKKEQYTYITSRLSGKITAIKCHSECHYVAKKLELLDRERLTKYWFTKTIKKYATDLIKQAGSHNKEVIKIKDVKNIPTRTLVLFIKTVLTELEGKNKPVYSHKVIQANVALYVVIFTATMVIDDLISDMTKEGLYRHNKKRIVNAILKDFERIGNSLYKLYENVDNVALEITESSISVLNKIYEDILLEGTEKTFNVLMSLLDNMDMKYQIMSEEMSVNSHLKHTENVRKQIKELVSYDRQPFVQIIVDKYCSEKDIKISD